MPWHGKLTEDAVDVIPAVELFDESYELILSRFLRQGVFEAPEAHVLAGLLFIINIHSGSGIVADDDDREGDLSPLLFQSGDLVADAILHARRYDFSVEKLIHIYQPFFLTLLTYVLNFLPFMPSFLLRLMMSMSSPMTARAADSACDTRTSYPSI